jgi:predicted membrane-bound dolichyl-phosphate-mannose-protein mannosyltransferase
MTDQTYELRYLPLFYDDLKNKLLYIANELKNPQAANNLLDAVENAIMERLPYAESFEEYHSKNERKYSYYRIYVENYIIWYVVIDDENNKKIMEVRRFAFMGQDQSKVI